MDFNFMLKYAPEYFKAACLMLYIGGMGIILSVLVGLIGSWVQYEKIPVLNKMVFCYVELSRNTPLLVQLFFLYFGLPKIGLKLSSELCGLIGLTFLGGSYMIEAFRSSLESINIIQKESALSLGMDKYQIMRYIIVPQAIITAMPSLSANIIFLLKETSVFSAISLVDMMFVTKDLIGLYYKTEEALFMLVFGYLLLLLPISFITHFLERRMRYAVYGD